MPADQSYEMTELASGIRVITEDLAGARSVAVGFWIGAGSRDEDPERAGVAHMIEHMMFKGGPRYDALRIAQVFDGLGSELNASTSREHTTVTVRVLDEHLPIAFDVMADMLTAPTWVELEPEREVVLEEIAMYEDDPQELVHDLLGAAVFGATDPLGRPVIGTTQTVAALDRDALAGWHLTMYTQPNLVVAAAGKVDHADLVARTEELLAPLSHAPRPDQVASGVIAGAVPRRVFAVRDTEQYHVCIGAPGLPRHDERRFAVALLDTMLGAAASSRLFQEIREKRGMAYSVYSYASHYNETGQVGVYLGTRAENLRECLRLVREQFEDLAAEGPGGEELARAKENLKGRVLLSMEYGSARMSRLGRSVLGGIEVLSLDEIADRIDAVGHDLIVELAAELLDPARLSLSGIGPDAARFDAAVGEIAPALVEA